MLQTGLSFLVPLFALGHAMASPVQARAAPTVQIDSATVTGATHTTSSGSTIAYFLGIPFAKPPTGDLRFRLPEPLEPFDKSFSAVEYGPSCMQHGSQPPDDFAYPPGAINYLNSSIYGAMSEDCLTLNVFTPANVDQSSNLPVVVWIYGGGFIMGGTDVYNGSFIVDKSIALGVPAVYVSMNYRVTAYGFLAGQQVKDAGVGNLGLHDQRLALQWVKKYIAGFGGNPGKVTIWGESAGAISVALQMLTNGGKTEDLFHAAFMQSGAPIPVGDITHGQKYFDAIAEETECNNATDKLQCLRDVPPNKLIAAVNKTPGIFSEQSLALAWMPRVDGVFLKANPMELVQQGSVADIPFVTGNCDDEGTIFSLIPSSGMSWGFGTDQDVEKWLRTYWLPTAPSDTITQLMKDYPQDLTKGSPFDTGDKFGYPVQYKRLAAFQGDAVFQAPRRFFIQKLSQNRKIWAFLSKRLKRGIGLIPGFEGFVGSFHASDLIDVYTPEADDMTSYLLRFATNLDPNIGLGDHEYWPQYKYSEEGQGENNQTMLLFYDDEDGQKLLGLTTDEYRVDEMKNLTEVILEYPL